MIHKNNNKNNNQGVFLELLVAAKKGSWKKISYERRVFESVDDKSMS